MDASKLREVLQIKSRNDAFLGNFSFASFDAIAFPDQAKLVERWHEKCGSARDADCGADADGQVQSEIET